MTKNPLINGLSAIAYIFIVALTMNGLTKVIGKTDSFLAPVAAISLFTLSAAIMGYIFGYQPIQLYFESKKKQAVQLFLRTVAVFAIITIIILVLLVIK